MKFKLRFFQDDDFLGLKTWNSNKSELVIDRLKISF